MKPPLKRYRADAKSKPRAAQAVNFTEFFSLPSSSSLGTRLHPFAGRDRNAATRPDVPPPGPVSPPPLEELPGPPPSVDLGPTDTGQTDTTGKSEREYKHQVSLFVYGRHLGLRGVWNRTASGASISLTTSRRRSRPFSTVRRNLASHPPANAAS